MKTIEVEVPERVSIELETLVDVHSQGERNSYGIRREVNWIVYVRHHAEAIRGLEELDYQQREASGQQLPESEG